jgi:hypothetical protein
LGNTAYKELVFSYALIGRSFVCCPFLIDFKLTLNELLFGLLNCCCWGDENIIGCCCWNIGGRTNDCCCCCGKNSDDCCWVGWFVGIKKSKSFDAGLFVVDDDDELIGCGRLFDVVCSKDSNGSNAIADDDDEGGMDDGLVVGQMEGCTLNKYLDFRKNKKKSNYVDVGDVICLVGMIDASWNWPKSSSNEDRTFGAST